MTHVSESTQSELVRRHRAAASVVGSLIVLTLALVALAYFAHDAIYRPGDVRIIIYLRIAILIFALGAIALRRTKFMAMRLQDIAGIRGISGLLETLQRTTVQVALLGGAIALLGFIGTIISNDRWEMIRAGGIAVIVLLYCYPRRAAWRRVVEGI